MKKVLLFGVIILFFIGAIASCGGNAKEDSSVEAQANDTPIASSALTTAEPIESTPLEEVSFGHYPQNSSTDSPIEWYVIAEYGDYKMLLSKYILDYQSFNDSTIAEASSWANSSLRAWLNDSFLNYCFTISEQEAIYDTTVTDYEADGVAGAESQDKVFLLNMDQVDSLLTYTQKVAIDTSYAEQQGGNNANGSWWLINSESSDLYKYVINRNGTHENSPRVNEAEGVRPCMWVHNSVLSE